MKIASFNVQHCNAFLEQKINYRVISDAILSLDADIVGLNEIYSRGEGVRLDEQTEVLGALTGYRYRRFARAIDFKDGRYGNGFLSRIPIESSEVIPVPKGNTAQAHYEDRCLLKVRLEGGITVLVIHFGLNFDEQENAVHTVLENLADEKCVLMGDFNIDPDSELLLPIRAKMKDTAELFDAPLLSFPSDRPNCKIDYIFVSPDVNVISADIPEIIASDHRPHTAAVEL